MTTPGAPVRFVRHFLTQSGLTGVSRVLGLIRDAVIAAKIGSGPVADAWFTALQFPNLFRRVLAEGAFSQAFVPLFTRSLHEDGINSARKMASGTLSLLFISTVVLTMLAQLAMPWIMLVMQVGYRDNPDIFELSIMLTRLTMPYLTAMAMCALFAGILNATERFALSALVPSLFNLCVIGTTAIFSSPVSCAVAASVGVVFSGALQLAILWHGAHRAIGTIPIHWPRLTQSVKQVVSLAIPGAIAASATQINIVVSQSLASLEHGAKSSLAYADRLYQLPLGLIGVAIGVAILPRLSRALAGDSEMSDALDQAICLSLALVLPASTALATIPFALIDGLFGRGEFTSTDATNAAHALFQFAWGAPAFVLIKVLAPAFFARGNTATPMRFALVAVVFNVVGGVTAFIWLRQTGQPGFVGLAAATSAAAWLNAVLLAVSLWRAGVYRPAVWVYDRLGRSGICCGVMGGVLVAVRTGVPAAWPAEMDMVALVGAGALSYLVCALGLGVVSPRDLGALIR